MIRASIPDLQSMAWFSWVYGFCVRFWRAIRHETFSDLTDGSIPQYNNDSRSSHVKCSLRKPKKLGVTQRR